jgi:hypothetical protein
MGILAVAGGAMRRLSAESILLYVFLKDQLNRAGDGIFIGILHLIYHQICSIL